MKSIRLAALISMVFATSVLADGAANAYVSIDAPGARNQGGVDFAVADGHDTVSVAVKAQPGWELTSSPVVVIPKGSAGSWSAKSFYGESGAGGEICIPTTTVSTNHVRAPKVDIKLQVNHGNGNGAKGVAGKGNDKPGNPNKPGQPGNPDPGPGNGNGPGDKDRGGTINIAASVKSLEPGLHRILKVHDSCPGGKSNVRTEDRKDFPVTPDTFKWTWSIGGQSGASTGETLLVPGVTLPRGKYTLSVTLTVSSSACHACTDSATATREINIGNGVIK